MQPGSRLRLTFEFDLAAEPVSGIVRDGLGDDVSFCGWMALAQTIELALASARGRQGDHPPATRET
jgi:hypothetical protein